MAAYAFRIIAAAAGVVIAAALPQTACGQAAQSPATQSPPPDAKPAQVGVTQNRLKDCALKWKDEKAAGNAKGRAAYNRFMSRCLKPRA